MEKLWNCGDQWQLILLITELDLLKKKAFQKKAVVLVKVPSRKTTTNSAFATWSSLEQEGIRFAWMQMNNVSPKTFAYIEVVGYNYYEACRREKQVKKFSKKKKEDMEKEYLRL